MNEECGVVSIFFTTPATTWLEPIVASCWPPPICEEAGEKNLMDPSGVNWKGTGRS